MKRAGQQTLLSFYKKRKPTDTPTGADPAAEGVIAPSAAGVAAPSVEPAAPAAEPPVAEPSAEPASEPAAEPSTEPSTEPRLSEETKVATRQEDTLPGTLAPWKSTWVESLSSEMRELLGDEIDNIGDSWLEKLSPELTKPYFKALKEFLNSQRTAKKVIFPPTSDIYSWSKLCELEEVKVVILGQDPYHNYNQAHGLAFSVLPPTAIPPSLRNIYKELGNCYPDYKKPSQGLLTPWAKQGVLLLNACLTVEAHKANSHANKGWETFTEAVLELVAKNDKVVFMAWGTPAFKRITKINPDKRHLILKSVHPSPLSASRGWFGSKHFILANEWLKENNLPEIDWQV